MARNVVATSVVAVGLRGLHDTIRKENESFCRNRANGHTGITKSPNLPTNYADGHSGATEVSKIGIIYQMPSKSWP